MGILYIDEKTGVVDLQMHPTDPDTLLVATYERQRDGFDGNDPGKKNGPGSGLYMTRDGGKNFKKITEGLPTNHLGRIGLSWAKSDPNYVYAVIETEKTGQVPENAAFMGINGEDVEVGARITNVVDEGPAFKAGFKFKTNRSPPTATCFLTSADLKRGRAANCRSLAKVKSSTSKSPLVNGRPRLREDVEVAEATLSMAASE